MLPTRRWYGRPRRRCGPDRPPGQILVKYKYRPRSTRPSNFARWDDARKDDDECISDDWAAMAESAMPRLNRSPMIPTKMTMKTAATASMMRCAGGRCHQEDDEDEAEDGAYT